MSQGLKAYITPFAVFILLVGLTEPVKWLLSENPSPLAQAPEHLLYPLQTLICAGLLFYFWPRYRMQWPRRALFAIVIAVIVFAVWVSPQEVFGITPRRGGFDPTLFAESPALYSAVVAMRFLRLVVIVPLLEEIFWRGFLLRYLVDDDFENVPIGAWSLTSFAVVTFGFMLEHSTLDWPAALIAGALYNVVAYRTRSLGACVLAHAVTNLLLGIYVMRSQQWGFW